LRQFVQDLVRRMAHLLAFAALLAAGAALATRAPAGVTVLTDSTGTEETGGVSTAEPEPVVPTEPAVPTEPVSTEEEPEPQIPPAWRSRPAGSHRPSDPAPTRVARLQRKVEAVAVLQQKREPAEPRAKPKLKPRPAEAPTAVDPEADMRSTRATIWLHRTLPDPIPPAARLAPTFATELVDVARSNRVGWALMLGVLRARGRVGAAPASPAQLRALAEQLSALGALSSPGRAVRRLSGSERFAERAVALAHYNRAVGLRSLVNGLEKAEPRLRRLALHDKRLEIYPGGKADIESGRIDIRVIVLIRYLADSYGQVTVSSLHSGHRLYARKGVVSAHIYGLAVDISALGRVSIEGHQEPGGLTERAVRSILLLPAELQPQQVISLLGLGGPSFPLGDHGDHIHVGY
jgi:outer membrane biosynthesis protein TonB